MYQETNPDVLYGLANQTWGNSNFTFNGSIPITGHVDTLTVLVGQDLLLTLLIGIFVTLFVLCIEGGIIIYKLYFMVGD